MELSECGGQSLGAEVHRASPKSARAPALMPLHPGSADGGGPRLPWCGLFHPSPEALPTLRGLTKPHTTSARLLPTPGSRNAPVTTCQEGRDQALTQAPLWASLWKTLKPQDDRKRSSETSGPIPAPHR